MKLTPKQKEVHDFLKAYVKEHKVYAGVSDMMEHFGLTRQGMSLRLLSLIEAGRVKRPRKGLYIPK